MKPEQKKILGFVLLAIIGTALPLLTLFPEPNQFSALGVFGVGLNLFIGGFKFIDYFLLPEFDTIEHIKKGNIAISLFMLSYAIIIFAVAIISFKAF